MDLIIAIWLISLNKILDFLLWVQEICRAIKDEISRFVEWWNV